MSAGSAHLSLTHPRGMTSRAILGWVAVVSAAGEFADAFFIEVPVVAVAMGLLFIVGWLLLRRGGSSGVILIGVLSAIELVGLAFYERKDADDWIFQSLFLVFGVIGVIAAVRALRWQRGTRP